MQQTHNETRRRFLAAATAVGVGHTLFPGALLALATRSDLPSDLSKAELEGVGAPVLPLVTIEMIEQASVIAGVSFTAEQRRMMLESVNGQRDDLLAVRKLPLPNSVAPSLVFDPVPSGAKFETIRQKPRLEHGPDAGSVWKKAGLPLEDCPQTPEGCDPLEALAFCSVGELGTLLRAKKTTSVALTKMYLARIKRLDKKLHCVVTLLEDRALKQAAQADRELAAGKYRGPLHGIPWGAKDLLSVAGAPTTWGARGFEQQQFDTDAAVVQRLDAAGAVLIAKLSMGALAQGDLWFGGRTRNPWNLAQGSSGSSAGSASAVSAGGVCFAIGTETLGSISSPSTRCGVTGLRPSFGLVPRTGAMALSWSMDKIGAIARSVEDAALVFNAICGPDGNDASVRSAAFNIDFTGDVRKLRVGYLKSYFEPSFVPVKSPTETLTGKALDDYNARVARNKAAYERQQYDAAFNSKTLEVLREMGITLIPKTLPDFPFGALTPMLEAEAAAAFDELTRSGRDALLNGQSPGDWPNQFRTARMYPAVDYIQAARARTLAIAHMTELFADVDVIVTPSSGTQLTATNLTGQPAVIVPNGFRGKDAPPPPSTEDGSPGNVGGPGTPVSITFLAPLYQDAKACALAYAYQKKTGFHLQHPVL